MTLLEMLAALMLLGLMAGLTTTWLSTAARFGASEAPRRQWQAAAQRILDRIGDDLVCGDFEPTATRDGARQPRVELPTEHRLRLYTRCSVVTGPHRPGPILHEYSLDHVSGVLYLVGETLDGSGVGQRRAILHEVARWECRHDEDNEMLIVFLARHDGTEARRVYPWP